MFSCFNFKLGTKCVLKGGLGGGMGEVKRGAGFSKIKKDT